MLAAIVSQSYSDKSLAEILAAPVTALAGISEEAASSLATNFKITSVESLGKNILFRFAQAMATMAGVKNDAVHSDWSDKLLRDAADEPPTVVKYISADQAACLEQALGIRTIKEMASCAPFRHAQALIALAS